MRWPLSADGANGISLVEAQGNYANYGAAHPDAQAKVRRPGPDEPLDAGWRPIDLTLDNVERDPTAGDRQPWPADGSRLYWWRPTYYRNPAAPPAPSPATPPEMRAAEALMRRVLDAFPETQAAAEQVAGVHEGPAPPLFFRLLSELALDALDTNPGLVARLVEVLNTGLTDGDANAYNCVAIGFLEDERWHAAGLETIIATWPTEIREELTQQREYAKRPFPGPGFAEPS